MTSKQLTQRQQEQIFLGYSEATINGIHFRTHADGTASRACRRGSKAEEMADIVLPHPTRGRNWCIAILKLPLRMAAIFAGAWLGFKLWILIQPHLLYAFGLTLAGMA